MGYGPLQIQIAADDPLMEKEGRYDPSEDLAAAMNAAGIRATVEYGGPPPIIWVELAKIVIPALAGVLIGWLKGRAGRKVTVWVDNATVGVGASNAKDVDHILDALARFQAKTDAVQKPSRIKETAGPKQHQSQKDTARKRRSRKARPNK